MGQNYWVRLAYTIFRITNQLTNYMEKNLSWEPNRFPPNQEIPDFLWNPNVHYLIHQSPPPVPILSQINRVSAPPPHLTSRRSILILPSHLHQGLPNGLLHSCFPLLCPIRAICPDQLIILYLIIRIVFGEEHRALSFSLRSLLHSSVTSSLLGPNIILSTLFSKTLSLHCSVSVSDQV
jgi:hypothetical protein